MDVGFLTSSTLADEIWGTLGIATEGEGGRLLALIGPPRKSHWDRCHFFLRNSKGLFVSGYLEQHNWWTLNASHSATTLHGCWFAKMRKNTCGPILNTQEPPCNPTLAHCQARPIRAMVGCLPAFYFLFRTFHHHKGSRGNMRLIMMEPESFSLRLTRNATGNHVQRLMSEGEEVFFTSVAYARGYLQISGVYDPGYRSSDILGYIPRISADIPGQLPQNSIMCVFAKCLWQ